MQNNTKVCPLGSGLFQRGQANCQTEMKLLVAFIATLRMHTMVTSIGVLVEIRIFFSVILDPLSSAQ